MNRGYLALILAGALVVTAANAIVVHRVEVDPPPGFRVGGNAAEGTRKGGYNGVVKDGLFDPRYSGLNFEAVYGENRLSEVLEPRLTPLSPQDGVNRFPLVDWGLDIETAYQVHGNTVDLTVSVTPTRDGIGSYAQLLFASYMHSPENIRIHYPTPDGWSAADAGSVCPTGVALPAGFAEACRGYYALPIMYGRTGQGTLLFTAQGDGPVLWMVNPTGAGEGNPAWDFFLVIDEPQVGRTYRFYIRMALVSETPQATSQLSGALGPIGTY